MAETRILVVDDEKEIADLIEIYLVSDGYKVFKANNAEEGLEILDREDIHLVLLDIMMPGMNGLDTVSYTHLDVYKRQAQHARLPGRQGDRWKSLPVMILRFFGSFFLRIFESWTEMERTSGA